MPSKHRALKARQRHLNKSQRTHEQLRSLLQPTNEADPADGPDEAQESNIVDPACTCEYCQEGQFIKVADQSIRPYVEIITNVEVSRHQLQCMRNDVNNLHSILVKLVDFHGPTLVERWNTATETSRRELLADTNIGMSSHNHAVLWDHIASCIDLPDESFTRSELLKRAPYLNTQTLCEDPVKLILLFQTRTKIRPEQFFRLDARQLLTAWLLRRINTVYHDGSVSTSTADYGTWKPLDLQRIHSNLDCSASHFDDVMTAQWHISTFLVVVAARILQGVVPSVRYVVNPHDGSVLMEGLNDIRQALFLGQPRERTTFLSGPARSLLQISEEEEEGLSKIFNLFMKVQQPGRIAIDKYLQNACVRQRGPVLQSLVTQNEWLPFQGCHHFDLRHLTDLVRTRLDEAYDDLWMTHTSPNFLYRKIIEAKDWINAGSPDDRPERWNEWFDRALINSLWLPIFSYAEWKGLLVDLEEASKLQVGNAEMSERRTGPRYLFLLGRVRLRARIFLNIARQLLGQAITANPALSQVLQTRREYRSQNSHSAFRRVRATYNKEMLQGNKALSALVYIGSAEPLSSSSCNVLQCLSFIEGADWHNHDLLSQVGPSINYHVSDMAVLASIIESCNHHEPVLTRVTPDTFRESRAHWFPSGQYQLPSVATLIERVDTTALCDTAWPPEKFNVQRSKTDPLWLAEMRRARTNLELLLKELQSLLKNTLESYLMPSDCQDSYLEVLRFFKSPEHLAEVRCEEIKFLKLHCRDGEDDKSSQAWSKLSSVKEESLVAFEPKKKVKIRGNTDRKPDALEGLSWLDQAPEQDDVTPHLPSAEPKQTKVLYQLPQELLQVTDLLFASSSLSPEGRTLPWKDFAAFMRTVGFRSTHCGGSRVRFEGVIQTEHALTPGETVKAKRPIMIHMPHPHMFYDFEKAREIGRRCTKRFGWRRASFAAEGEVV